MRKPWSVASKALLFGVAGFFAVNCFAQSGNIPPEKTSEEATIAVALSSDPVGFAAPASSNAASEADEPQPTDPSANVPAAPEPQTPTGSSKNRKFGVGGRISTLGIGGEAAYRLTRTMNVRVGFNLFSDHRKINNDDVNYDGDFGFRSVEAHFDWFFFRSLHLSPGLLAYNGDRLTSTASVPAGGQFTLNDTPYESSAASPVTGSGTVNMNRVAPTLLIGWGNLVPRTHKRLSISGEVGALYQGTPKVALSLNGVVCTPPLGAGPYPTCQSTVTTAIQSQITGEQTKIVGVLSPYLRFYPVVAVGVGYTF